MNESDPVHFDTRACLLLIEAELAAHAVSNQSVHLGGDRSQLRRNVRSNSNCGGSSSYKRGSLCVWSRKADEILTFEVLLRGRLQEFLRNLQGNEGARGIG